MRWCNKPIEISAGPKKLVAAIFLVAFCFQTFSKPFIIADYYANTAAYAKNCENKARPQMKCNGHCQMMKKLKAEEKKDAENPERKAESKAEITLSSKSFYATIATPAFEQIANQKFVLQSNGHSTDRSIAVFHPPQV